MSDLNLFRWLHITDLHIGSRNESQISALNSLLDAISSFSGVKTFDFVLLSGDLAFSGKREEYIALENNLIAPLRAHHLTKGAEFIAAPGNHDLDCDVELPVSWKSIGPKRQERFFYLGEDGAATRGSRCRGFSEYSLFVSRNNIHSADPLNEPVREFRFCKGGQTVSIISTVTAFFSDKEVNDRLSAPFPLHPIRKLVQEGKPADHLLVLGHHPPAWFTLESQRQLHSFLVEKGGLYLHGHEHQVTAKFGARGLTSIGFGAAYVAPSEAAPLPMYRNSFAICELNQSLHVFVASWDAEHGQWRPEQHLPGDFFDPSERLDGGFRLSLPTTRLTNYVAHTYSSLAAAIKQDLQIDRTAWLVTEPVRRWASLLQSMRLVREGYETFLLPSQALPVGHAIFRLRDSYSSQLIYAISGQGDVLNYEHVQWINTELDRHDYSGCIVATLGEIASEAKILAQQLAIKKPITLLERSDVIRRCLAVLPSSAAGTLRQAADAGLSAGSLIFTDSGIAVLLIERTSNLWFQIIGENGLPLPESSPLVLEVTRELSTLRAIRYRSPAAKDLGVQGNLLPRAPFDKREYLIKTHEFFEDIRYAPLAAIGMPLRKASLSKIYVEASADVGGSTKATQHLNRSIAEIVDSLNLPKSQRDQLESQLRSSHGLNRSAEVGVARKLYQRYNNIVVLGDPGSGKTCFVQHEILAYCEAQTQGDWYSHHLPVYVSLAEAARLLKDDTSILEICEVVSARRAVYLPQETLEELLSEGKVAFFFDGLDEVGFIDKRISLLAQIDKLVSAYASRGNRFVLASRPAAVQPVDIPEEMTYLHLKGLRDEEIKVLAGRVLTARIGTENENSLTDDEKALIDRLLSDSRNSPGIGRIARNPLLLTLLVLTYATTGALYARRHVIYSQAIKTLVSVRQRETREQRISEADLRKRLGTLALSIFDREIAELPKRSEVAALLARSMNSNGGVGAALKQAEAFIQEVAEATGLLTIHSRDDGASEELVTFMHYSFLEYYTAAALLSRPYIEAVGDLAGNPRWKDVVTLLFGILSEQGDVTPIFERMVSHSSESERITCQKILMAFDCAYECDVPPEDAQIHLCGALRDLLALGPGRYSAKVRSEIASRLGILIHGCGPRVDEVLVEGLRNKDALIGAAFADLLARLDDDIELSATVVSAFADGLSVEHPTMRAACLFAIERRSELRGGQALTIVKASLRGSIVEKHAALKVIASVPTLAAELESELRTLLDDSNALVAASAAHCLLSLAIRTSVHHERPGYIEKALAKIEHDEGQEAGVSVGGVSLGIDAVQELVASGDRGKKELAIRYLSLVEGDEQGVYGLIMDAIRDESAATLKIAALRSLQQCASVIPLITIADTDVLCDALRDGNRGIRLAAARLLGELPDDEHVVRSLQDYLKASSDDVSRSAEVSEAAKALAKHVRRNPRLRQETLRSLVDLLPQSPREGFGNANSQNMILALLSVCESIGEATEGIVGRRLLRIAEDFRAPIAIRAQAMRVVGRLVEPSIESVRTLIVALARDDHRFNESIYSWAASLAEQCRRKVEYMRRVHSVLEDLVAALCEAWVREARRSVDSIDSTAMKDIRLAILEIRNLTLAYEDFSERAELNSTPR